MGSRSRGDVEIDRRGRQLDSDPQQPSEPRRALTASEQAVGVLFGLWMVLGLFLDGWAHDNGEPESFFTPWHGVLYSGFLAASGAALYLARPRSGASWRRSMPRGHGLTLIGLLVFATGAMGDLVWHEVLGVELGLEALLSPTHLLLLVGGLIALSAPFRSVWSDSDERIHQPGGFVVLSLSLALLVSIAGFFLVFLSPFVNDAAGARFDRQPAVLHDHPSTDVGELQQLLGVASILVTTVLLVVPILLVLRRWMPPPHTFLLLITVVVVLFVGLAEFDQVGLLPVGAAAGWSADLAVRKGHPQLAGVVMSAVLWSSYFALYHVTVAPVAWSAELWTGSIVLAVLFAGGLTLVAGPMHSRAWNRPIGTDHETSVVR